MTQLRLFGMPVSTGSYQQFLYRIISLAESGKSEFVCVANVHMLIESRKNVSFQQVVEQAAIVTADGMPLTWALKWLYGIKQKRIAGMFLMQDLLQKAEVNGTTVFFYGGTEEVLVQANRFLNNAYPKLKIGGFISPPFRELSNEEEEEHVRIINRSGAKLVFVALGCPKQEKWMAKMKGKINAVMIGIGAALPVMVGMRKKAPMWIQAAGLEWLFRLSLEPRRLFKRYAITNSVFLWLLFKEVVVLRKSKRSLL